MSNPFLYLTNYSIRTQKRGMTMMKQTADETKTIIKKYEEKMSVSLTLN